MNWIDERSAYLRELVANTLVLQANHVLTEYKAKVDVDIIAEKIRAALQATKTHYTAEGAQEALAKVEEWVKINSECLDEPSTNGFVDADDLLHHLQQLKDNKEV